MHWRVRRKAIRPVLSHGLLLYILTMALRERTFHIDVVILVFPWAAKYDQFLIVNLVWCEVWLMKLPGIYKSVAQIESCCTFNYKKFGRCISIFGPALTLYCRRTYADDSHRNGREEPQGEDLRQDPRCLYVRLDLTACQQLQLDKV